MVNVWKLNDFPAEALESFGDNQIDSITIQKIGEFNACGDNKRSNWNETLFQIFHCEDSRLEWERIPAGYFIPNHRHGNSW